METNLRLPRNSLLLNQGEQLLAVWNWISRPATVG